MCPGKSASLDLREVQERQIREKLEFATAQGRMPDGYRRSSKGDGNWHFVLLEGERQVGKIILPMNVFGLIRVDAQLLKAGIRLRQDH
jgi:hypothetical protein